MSDLEQVSLFSLEVAVNTVFIRRAVVCRVPLVAFRLLDYPTIGISLLTDEELKKIKDSAKENPTAAERTYQITQLQHSTGTYVFSQGKSCLLKRRLSELHKSLTSVPLYIMLLDVLSEPPKLVASCSVSLEGMTRRIVRDVSVNGIEVPSTQGEKDIFSLYNLMGDKIGEAEVGLRLTSLGVSMMQHVLGVSEPGTTSQLDDEILRKHKPSNKDNLSSSKPRSHDLGPVIDVKLMEEKRDSDKENEKASTKKKGARFATAQTVLVEKLSKSVQFPLKAHQEKASSTENIFCPPALYYEKGSETMPKSQQKTVQTSQPKHVAKEQSSHEAERYIAPSVAYRSPVKRDVEDSQTGTEAEQNTERVPLALDEFPLLKALVEEVSKLGLINERDTHPAVGERPVTKAAVGKSPRAEKPYVGTLTRPLSSARKSAKKQPERKQPLRFGLTNTMRLRLAMNKPVKRREEVQPATARRAQKVTHPPSLGQTFIKSRESKGVKMVTKACGPDDSMYRRQFMSPHPSNIQPQTVFLGRMPGYEEATDLDAPSLAHLTSESRYDYVGGAAVEPENAATDIEDLVIVKDIVTPRAHSRQSQRSIEIRLPTASTEFTLGREDDEGEWESTFSDKEKIEEMRRAKKQAKKEIAEQSELKFYTPPESPDLDVRHVSSSESMESQGKNIPASKTRLVDSRDKNLSSDLSDRYKYSDDFDDDKTWSANRTPSAVTPIPSSQVIHEVDENEDDGHIAPLPSKSMDSTITTTRTSDFTESSGNEIIRPFTELQSASTHKMPSSDDGFDSSSVSKGTSIVTALASKSRQEKSPATPKKMKVGGAMIPEPIPSDSPVVQSINTESSSAEQFPDPRVKHGLVSKAPKHKKKSSSKEVHLPKNIKETVTSASKDAGRVETHPKPSGFTPSPPSTRRFSPLSSPESSKERLRRYYHHPGRRTRTSSSGTYSSDYEKPVTPVRRSDSVSSYQPSDMSEMSNVKLSEELENLSDILSEENDSQVSRSSIRSKEEMPSDAPKTYFGKPKLYSSSKLGYTT